MDNTTSSKDLSQMSTEELKRRASELEKKIEEKRAFLKERKRENSESKGEKGEKNDKASIETRPDLGGGLRYEKPEPVTPPSPAPAPQRNWQPQRVEDRVSTPKPAEKEKPNQTRREIDELREKLRALEEKSKRAEYQAPSYSRAQEPTQAKEETPPYTPPQPPEPKPAWEDNEAKPEPKLDSSSQDYARYGVKPAGDLDSRDFDWQGSVGGVEIERSTPEEGGDDNIPDRSKVLEEIEHPPAYVPSTPFDEKLSQNNSQPSPISTNIPNNEPGLETEIEERPKEELEKRRKEHYRDGDPYREPIE